MRTASLQPGDGDDHAWDLERRQHVASQGRARTAPEGRTATEAGIGTLRREEETVRAHGRLRQACGRQERPENYGG